MCCKGLKPSVMKRLTQKQYFAQLHVDYFRPGFLINHSQNLIDTQHVRYLEDSNYRYDSFKQPLFSAIVSEPKLECPVDMRVVSTVLWLNPYSSKKNQANLLYVHVLFSILQNKSITA